MSSRTTGSGPTILFALSALTAAFLGGCCTSKEAQLNRVAKDWCLTIRASQVIPVYPLTEDLQPGDVFLVQVPIDRQQKVYKERGFLPLDHLVARIDPDGFTDFYDHSFINSANRPTLPRDWIRPGNSASDAWQPAPHVAFPSYSFSVRRGAGMNLAVPVQGVPVGLSLLGSDAADGSVSIKQAQTLGVDTLSLYRQVQSWARTNADFLRFFGTAPEDAGRNYLRVVTRVFATGEMDVSLRSTASQSAGLDVGVPKPVDLLFPELPDRAAQPAGTVNENFASGLETLQKMVAEAGGAARDPAGNFLPGGSLRLTGASARTVSLREAFNPPVIVGYLGFDVAIHPGGRLGPPIPTHAVLKPDYDYRRDLDRNPSAAIYSEAALQQIYERLSAAPDDSVAAAATADLDALARFVPNGFTSYRIVTHAPPMVAATNLARAQLGSATQPYLVFASYRARLAQSVRALDWALQTGSFQFMDASGASEGVSPGSAAHVRLRRARDELERELTAPDVNGAARRAGIAATVQFLEIMSQ